MPAIYGEQAQHTLGVQLGHAVAEVPMRHRRDTRRGRILLAMTSIGLRPAMHADSARCYQLHRAAMRGYIEAVWGWNEPDQQTFHDRGFDPDHTRIITADGHDAGVLIVDYQPDQIYLGRIEIHPHFQGRGIGSQLIHLLLREAADRGQPVELDVLTVNLRAYALYQRLGFQEINRRGPHDIKIRMRAEPGPATVHNA